MSMRSTHMVESWPYPELFQLLNQLTFLLSLLLIFLPPFFSSFLPPVCRKHLSKVLGKQQ